MKRSLALIVSLASGLALSAAAQTPAAPAAAAPAGPAKVAVIAFQVAVAQTNEGQRDFADVERKYEPKREQLKKLSDEIDTLTKQLQAQASTLSPAEQQSKANAIDNKKKQLDRDAQDAQNDFQQELQEIYNNLASKVYDVLQSYAELHGYTLVLDAQQQSPVLYASTATVITKEIIDAYNQKSGIPAPPAGAAPSGLSAPKPAAPRSTAPKPAAH